MSLLRVLWTLVISSRFNKYILKWFTIVIELPCILSTFCFFNNILQHFKTIYTKFIKLMKCLFFLLTHTMVYETRDKVLSLCLISIRNKNIFLSLIKSWDNKKPSFVFDRFSLYVFHFLLIRLMPFFSLLLQHLFSSFTLLYVLPHTMFIFLS